MVSMQRFEGTFELNQKTPDWSNSNLKTTQVREGLVREGAELYLQLHKRNSNNT